MLAGKGAALPGCVLFGYSYSSALGAPMAHENLMKRQSQRSGSESEVDPFELRFRIPIPIPNAMALVLGYDWKQ
jgi:hypothetical protein